MTKIIFLDIDGVIATARSIAARGYSSENEAGFDPIVCELIQKLCIDYGYKLVISSTWALHGMGTVRRCLHRSGLTADWHDDWRTPRKMSSSRQHEIAMWLDNHPEVAPKDCVVIDDIDCRSMREGRDGLLVIVCDPHVGFSYEDYCTVTAHNGGTPPRFLM